MSAPRYRPVAIGAGRSATVERRADGSTLLRSTAPLGDHPRRLTDVLEHWAATAPERTFVARRWHGGDWQRISYAQMLGRARAVGATLLERRLGVDRPIAILSDNDLEHLTLALGAMYAGIPYSPSPPRTR